MKNIIINSGGLDSAVCLALYDAKYKDEEAVCLAFNYGQVAQKELECAQRLSDYYNLQLQILDIREIFKFTNNVLLQNHDYKTNGSPYVPFRNGVILSSAVTFGMSLYPTENITVWTGINCGSTVYCDATKRYVKKMNKAVKEGTNDLACIYAPFAKCNKTETIEIGLEYGAPFHLTWSCHLNEDKPCGICPSCLGRAEAFAALGLRDSLIS